MVRFHQRTHSQARSCTHRVYRLVVGSKISILLARVRFPLDAIYIKTETRVNVMKTRRRGGTEPRDVVRMKQIKALQEARQNEIYELGDRIGSSNWVGPSEEKLRHLRELIAKNNELLRKGRGRSRTRRNKFVRHL